MQATDRPSYVLRDLARNPSSLPEARLSAAIELYLREGSPGFTDDMRSLLSQVREYILSGSANHILGPAIQLKLLQHLNAKCDSVRQSADEGHARIAEAVDSKHAALSADLSEARQFAEGVARSVDELCEQHDALQDQHEQHAEEQGGINSTVSERLERLEAEPQHAQSERDELAARVERLERCWLVRFAQWISSWSVMCLKLSELNPPAAERMQAATAADTRSAPSAHNARASRF